MPDLGLCVDCLMARRVYDGRVSLIRPGWGDIYRVPKVFRDERVRLLVEHMILQEPVWWEYMQSKESCDVVDCSNGSKNKLRGG